jgi:hypothetical protein
MYYCKKKNYNHLIFEGLLRKIVRCNAFKNNPKFKDIVKHYYRDSKHELSLQATNRRKAHL